MPVLQQLEPKDLEGVALKHPLRGSPPKNPIPQNHVHGFANGGQGESFPLQGLGRSPKKEVIQ